MQLGLEFFEPTQSTNIATKRGEVMLWHIKQIVAAEARDGLSSYQVVYEDSQLDGSTSMLKKPTVIS